MFELLRTGTPYVTNQLDNETTTTSLLQSVLNQSVYCTAITTAPKGKIAHKNGVFSILNIYLVNNTFINVLPIHMF